MQSFVAVILHEPSLECVKAVPQTICSARAPEILLDSTFSYCRPNKMRSANPAYTNLWRPVMISNISDLSNIGVIIHTSARKQVNAIMVKHELHQ
jgi:hypothetical protein